jgi:ligand-binding SRPBCC domain-containing protein
MAFHEFQVSSVVAASPAAVWARVSTMEGVNAELAPLARMTYPRQLARLDPAIVPLGRRVFRSWILLFGVLPVDFDDLVLTRVEPGHGFLESSSLLSQRRWIHERTLEPVAGGCRVTDRIGFEPRVPFAGRLFLAVFRFFFRHRHRRLQRAFARQCEPEETTTWQRP